MSFEFYRGGREGEDFGPPPPPFRIRRPRRSLGNLGGFNRWIFLALAVLVLYIVLNTLKGLYVDWLWFEGAGYRSVYSKILQTRLLLFFGGAGLFLLYFGVNAYIAARSVLPMRPAGFAEHDADALGRLYQLGLIAGAIFLAIIFGTIAAGQWDTVLRFTNRESFGIEDPQYGRDLGFYVFTLPALDFAQDWALGVTIMTTLVVAGLYLSRFLLVGVRSREIGPTKAHLAVLLLAVIAVFVWGYWLDTFELVLSDNGTVFGATYTDVHARLPAIWVSAGMAVLTGVALVFTIFRRGVALPMAAMGAWAVVAIAGTLVYPNFVQRFTVDPNELELEREYIERNIEATRRAFGLDQFQEEPFDAQPEVSQEVIAENPETIQNVRLLDVRPVLQTYGQIQTIRPLYEFNDLDIDRYMVDGQQRQVLIGARELTPDRLPENAQSWVNRRLQFTHGYGVVMSPVNEVVQEGLPQLFLRDIPVTGPVIDEVPVERPEIYYGEQPDHYVVVKTEAREFDYPTEGGNEQNVFEGEGGVKVGNFLRRLIFAWEFGDINIAISDSLTDESRILWRRNIQQRVEHLAPFLTLDRDPYVVVADGRIFWVQDAYTTTTRYPYSRPSAEGYNYIRNSVKVVVDAYDGTTTFYIADPSDPIIRTYDRIFPDLLTPISEMPPSLRSHVRYPEDLFKAQIQAYRTYHITQATVLYNQEDLWNIPREIFDGQEVDVEPYYVIMRLPGESEAEFVLIMPLVPARRANTIAWVAARSDGDNYGRVKTFRFPTDTLVFGPQQVETRITQDPLISSQFSLWDQAGSNVTRGNLLMIPIGRGNLFVEPIYLRADSSQLPELKRVIVVNGNRIAMEPTLQRSLEVVFGQAAPTAPTTADVPGSGGGVTSPPPSPTAVPPAPTTIPGQVPTAEPTVDAPPSGSIAELSREAEAAFQRAEAALRSGDLAGYQSEVRRAQDLIRQIAVLSGQ